MLNGPDNRFNLNSELAGMIPRTQSKESEKASESLSGELLFGSYLNRLMTVKDRPVAGGHPNQQRSETFETTQQEAPAMIPQSYFNALRQFISIEELVQTLITSNAELESTGDEEAVLVSSKEIANLVMAAKNELQAVSGGYEAAPDLKAVLESLVHSLKSGTATEPSRSSRPDATKSADPAPNRSPAADPLLAFRGEEIPSPAARLLADAQPPVEETGAAWSAAGAPVRSGGEDGQLMHGRQLHFSLPQETVKPAVMPTTTAYRDPDFVSKEQPVPPVQTAVRPSPMPGQLEFDFGEPVYRVGRTAQFFRASETEVEKPRVSPDRKQDYGLVLLGLNQKDRSSVALVPAVQVRVPGRVVLIVPVDQEIKPRVKLAGLPGDRNQFNHFILAEAADSTPMRPEVKTAAAGMLSRELPGLKILQLEISKAEAEEPGSAPFRVQPASGTPVSVSPKGIEALTQLLKHWKAALQKNFNERFAAEDDLQIEVPDADDFRQPVRPTSAMVPEGGTAKGSTLLPQEMPGEQFVKSRGEMEIKLQQNQDGATKENPEPSAKPAAGKTADVPGNKMEQQGKPDPFGGVITEKHTDKSATFPPRLMFGEAERYRFKRLVLQRIQQTIRTELRPEVTNFKVKLVPESLGQIEFRLTVTDRTMTAHFVVENETVKAILDGGMESLHKALNEKGIYVDKIEVKVQQGTPAGDQPKASDSRQDGQAAGQQPHDRPREKRKQEFRSPSNQNDDKNTTFDEYL